VPLRRHAARVIAHSPYAASSASTEEKLLKAVVSPWSQLRVLHDDPAVVGAAVRAQWTRISAKDAARPRARRYDETVTYVWDSEELNIDRIARRLAVR
jgi:hypothetical protein